MNEAECVLAIARPMSASQPFVTSRRRFSTRDVASSVVGSRGFSRSNMHFTAFEFNAKRRSYALCAASRKGAKIRGGLIALFIKPESVKSVYLE